MMQHAGGSVCSLILLLVVCASPLSASFCGTDQGKSFDVQESTINGAVINVAYVSDTVILILTDTTYLYRTSDGGDTWTVMSTDVMQIFPNADNSIVYVTQKNVTLSSIWVFSPATSTFTMKQPLYINMSLFLQPHYSSPSLVVVRMANNTLKMSEDGLNTWVTIDDAVYFGSWGYNGSFYYNCDGSLKVARSVHSTPETLMDVNNGILAAQDLLFIAVPSSSGALQLMSSKNRGEGPWVPAYFPDTILEYRYTILDVSVGSVIIAVVNDDTSGTTATIYMSDTADSRFTKILTSVRRKVNGHTEFKLTSITGVLLANQYTSKSGTVQTLITYDNGGKWQLLPSPTKCSGKNCGVMLHLSGKNDNEMWGPIVVRRSAVGLILGTGTVGTYVANTNPNMTATFFSRTAGMEWQQVVSYSSIYEYGDHGGLMVLADNYNPTSTLSYSWNEGMSLVGCTFTKDAITVKDIISGPNPTTQSFLMHGQRADGTTALIHIDFTGLHERVCEFPGDYEDWSVLGDKCLLGQRITYTRRKQTSECYNPLGYDTEILSNICGCTAEDYECDFCYDAQADGSCKNTCANPQNNNCTGTNDHFYISRGYRLVPGTVCDPAKGLNLLPKRISCSKTSGIATGAIVAVVVLFVVALLVGAVFLFKNERTRRWIEDRVIWARSAFSSRSNNRNNAWADSVDYLDSDTEADDAPILNDEAIIHLSENSSPVK